MEWKGPTWGQWADAVDEARANINAHAQSAQAWMAYAKRLEAQIESQQQRIEAQQQRINALEVGHELREQVARVEQLETKIETLKRQSTVAARDALWALFAQARSQQAGLQSVVAALTEEIGKLDPTHKLLDDWWRDTIRGPAFYEEWDRLKEAGIEQVLKDYERDGGHVDMRATAAKQVRTTEAEEPQPTSSGVDFKL